MSVKAYSFLWLIRFATAFFIINVLFIFVDMNSSAYDFHLGAFLKNMGWVHWKRASSPVEAGTAGYL